MENFRAYEMMVPIFQNGELVYKLPTLKEIKTYCAAGSLALYASTISFKLLNILLSLPVVYSLCGRRNIGESGKP